MLAHVHMRTRGRGQEDSEKWHMGVESTGGETSILGKGGEKEDLGEIWGI